MTEEIVTVSLSSQAVCPIIGDILNGLRIAQIIEKRSLPDPSKDENSAIVLATAFVSVGSIIASAAGADAKDLAESGDLFGDAFMKAVIQKGEAE